MRQLVSILIPAYNAEKWIKYTIESALSQTWKKNEIIIVDDGSRDRTRQIIKKYASTKVKVVTKENSGASAARNTALSYAQGDYIQWLDADDLLAPNKIEEQMKVADIGRTSLTLISSPHGIFYWRTEKARFIRNALWHDLSPIEWLTIKYSENLWCCPVGWLVSRRLTDMAGPWNERLSLDDDGEYFCRVIVKSEFIKFVSEARSYYRNSSFNQQSRKLSQRSMQSWLMSQKLCFEHIRSLENSDRIRRIQLELLQRWAKYFYVIDDESFEIFSTHIRELGGTLNPLRFGTKDNLMMNLFGNREGLKIMQLLRTLKLAANVKLDELLFIINKLAGKKSHLKRTAALFESYDD
jgi:glycosyltransferase involved in cell wall biosynthesis